MYCNLPNTTYVVRHCTSQYICHEKFNLFCFSCVPDVRPASPTITVLLVVALVLALVAAGFLFIK